MSGPRTIAVLAGAALASLAATVVVYADRQEPRSSQITALFPDLPSQLSTVTSISVSGSAGTVTAQIGGTTWTMPALDGYAAEPAVARGLLAGLADLRLEEAKTALPALHGRLGVAASGGEDARGHRIILADASGEVIADLIIGDRGRIGPGPSRYVRRPTEDQVWLAHGAIDIPDTAIDWVDRQIFDIPATEIVEVEIAGPDRPSLVIRRDPASDTMTIVDLPDDRMVEQAYRVANMATILEDLDFTDVRHAADLEWPDDGARGVLRTSTGLVLTAELAADPLADDIWVRFRAPDIAEHLAPWAFRLPRHKTDRLQATIEDITAPRTP